MTGGRGQLALCIKDLSKALKDYLFIYVDHNKLDITKREEINVFFSENKIDYCINCAAYTAVDKAESEKHIAKSVNKLGAKYIAKACKENEVVLIQISTDFVFDGEKNTPYIENDVTKPINFYGLTKLEGELAVTSILDNFFLIRTSWLYSEYGNNFMKTILKLGKEKEELNIIYDQVGTPTYAGDLAGFILKLITEKSNLYGIYHYSNEGLTSWYDFTKAIFNLRNLSIKVNPIKTEEYKQEAKRPMFSVLDKSKTKKTFNIEIPYWRDSLRKILLKMNHLSN